MSSHTAQQFTRVTQLVVYKQLTLPCKHVVPHSPGHCGQNNVPLVLPVQLPLAPAAQLESCALQVMPEQITVEPSQQWAVQLEVTATPTGSGTDPGTAVLPGDGARAARNASSA
ncbi:MAG: hypothetical protein U0002_13480 [Thermoanaerobaculia bacterium]